MANIIPMQDLYASMQNESNLCSFDIELIQEPTRPLIHPMARFWLVTKGQGTLMLNNRPYPLEAGSLVSVLPWQITDITQVTSPLSLFVLAYYFDNVNGIIKNFGSLENQTMPLLQILSSHPVVRLDEKDQDSLSQLFLQIRDEIGLESAPVPQEHPKKPQPLSSLYITNKLIEIMIRFIRCQSQTPPETWENSIDPSQIFLYLYSHLSQKITLESLSQLFFMSESAISSYITNTTGLSFFDLLNEMRVGKTINYLLYTDLTLEELAEILGFVDSAHISKVFSARIGMNANEFRNTYQQAANICRIGDRREFYALVSYIYRNYSQDLRPREVGKRFHMSPRELNRILLCQVELGFSDFLNFVRVNRASELLLQTRKSILEIALEVGYRSEKTLSRNFLKFRSMTPGKFRRGVQLASSADHSQAAGDNGNKVLDVGDNGRS